jgi:hypothetical protein
MPTAEEFDTWRKRIWDELVWLHDSWEQYKTLFHSTERVTLLNVCARWYFGSTQRLLLREVILGISRLTDPLEIGGRTNLVIRTLLLDPALNVREDVKNELTQAIQAAVVAAQPFRKHRHKYIAHLDHAVAIGSEDEPLPGLRREEITRVVGLMEAAYNVHGSRIRDSYAMFEMNALGNVDALIAILESSTKWERWQEYERRKLDGDF